MQDRRAVRGARLRGTPIEVVVEDGFDRAVGAGTDIAGTLRRRFETRGAIGTGQPDDAQTGTEALLRVRPLLEDQLAKRCRRQSDQPRVLTDAVDRPAGIAPVGLDGMCSATVVCW